MNPSIAHTINHQIRNSVMEGRSGVFFLMCWGFNRPIAYPSGLQFRVNGRKFKGVVRVELNGNDYYDIQFFIKEKGEWVYKTMCADVDCESLLSTLDRLIES